jgi:small GTP-binding protein
MCLRRMLQKNEYYNIETSYRKKYQSYYKKIVKQSYRDSPHTNTMATRSIVLLGDVETGKTSLAEYWKEGNFNNEYVKTIGVDLIHKKTNLNGQDVFVKIWDASGQDRFRTLTDYYLRTCDAVIIVFDVTETTSFENVSNWSKTVREVSGNAVPVALVANKVDLLEKRCVDKESGENYAKELGAEYFETSCVNGHNIEKLFQFVLQDKGISASQSDDTTTIVQFSNQQQTSNGISFWRKIYLFFTCNDWRAVDAESIKPLTSPEKKKNNTNDDLEEAEPAQRME